MRFYKFHTKARDHRVQEQARKQASAWKMGGLTGWQLTKRVYSEFWEDELMTRSSGLSFWFIAALVPMLFFVVTTLGFFAQSQNLQSSFFDYMGRLLPPDAFTLLQKTLRGIARHATGLKLAIGLTLALWSGSGGISSVMDALNRCYHVKDERPYWKQKLLAICLTIALAALTVAALIMVLYGGSIAEFVGNKTGLSNVVVLAWRIGQWMLAVFFVMLSFALMYYFGPDVDQKWQWITPGSLFGVLLWIGVSLGFRAYLHYFNSFNKTYGSLGAVIILLYWLFITGLAILIGGEINSEIENAAAQRGHPDAKAEGKKVA
ncbi:MAG: YihY/virulence factor BrkB family protein [Actinomycetota bacterium]